MTVCIATVFPWTYAPGVQGLAIVTAADRMLTAGDIEYEPPKLKIGLLNNNVVVMVAGEIVIHSEALVKTQRFLAGSPETNVGKIAEIYASFIREFKTRHAVQLYLSPLGLDEKSFLQAQRAMPKSQVAALVQQLQYFEIDVAAIVAGCDDLRADIHIVDNRGTVTYHDDVGFAAIGLGSGHAKSHFMFSGYAAHASWYIDALFMTYSAKKRAEVAPGVGKETDMHLITRDGVNAVQLDIMNIVRDIYDSQEEKKKTYPKKQSKNWKKNIRAFIHQLRVARKRIRVIRRVRPLPPKTKYDLTRPRPLLA